MKGSKESFDAICRTMTFDPIINEKHDEFILSLSFESGK